MSDLSKCLDDITKELGDTIVARIDRKPEPVDVVSTGVLSIDRALGIGGFPRQRITTLFGPESGGKTTLCLWSLGRLIAAGGKGVYVDLEQGGSEQYVFDCLSNAGVDVNRATDQDNPSLAILRPDRAEPAMEAIKALVKHVDMIVIDSISAMMTAAELAAKAGDQLVALRARLLTSEFNKLNSRLGSTNCSLVVISQIRANIGTMGGSEGTSEPNALKHLASVRLRVSKADTIVKKSGKPYMQPARIVVRKNKLGAPGASAAFDIIFGEGVDMVPDTLAVAEEEGVIRRGGSYYYYPADPDITAWDMRVNTKAATIDFLRQNGDLHDQIREEVLEAIRNRDGGG